MILSGKEVFYLVSGINIAQAIRENSVYALINRQDKGRSKICFFISHKDEDTDAAIVLGKHITEDFGYNIYLDVYDNELQEADKNNDPDGIVNAIHKGIQYASHLLCVVTNQRILGGSPMRSALLKPRALKHHQLK